MDADLLARLLQQGAIRCLVFDFDGTLYESSAGVEQQLKPLMVEHTARVLGVSPLEARTILAHYREEHRSSILGLQMWYGVDPHEFYDAVYNDLDLSRMQPRLGLRSALERLAASVPLVIFTNSNRSFTLRAMDRLSLTGPPDIFHTIRTVEDGGFIRKPQEEAYQRMYADLGFCPGQVAMFDDIASSLEVLSRLGSYTVLVGNGLRPAPQFVDLHTGVEYFSAPAFVDASTHDLVGFIEAVNTALARKG